MYPALKLSIKPNVRVYLFPVIPYLPQSVQNMTSLCPLGDLSSLRVSSRRDIYQQQPIELLLSPGAVTRSAGGTAGEGFVQ